MKNEDIYKAVSKEVTRGCRPSLILKKLFPSEFEEFEMFVGSKNTSNRLYDFLFPSVKKLCECGAVLKFANFTYGYPTYCSKACARGSDSERSKREQTMLSRYGVTSTNKLEAVKEKKRATFVARYGVDSALKSTEVRAKGVITLREKYGVDNVFEADSIKNKIKEDNLVRYGVENSMQRSDVKLKMQESMLARHGFEYAQQSPAIRKKTVRNYLERYGVEHHMQRPEILISHSRKRYRRKDVVIGGVEFSLQGYEPQAVEYLINNYGVDPAILKGSVPSIPYEHSGKLRRYIPDFVVGDLLIEVKSPYTAGMEGSAALRDQTGAKLRGARDAGYNTLLMVMNKDGSLHAASYNGSALSPTLSDIDSEEVRKTLS